MEEKYVVVVTSKEGVFDCILDCGILESLEDANKAILESTKEDKKYGWHYEYLPVLVSRKTKTS